MEHQCDVEIMKVVNGFLVMHPRGPVTNYELQREMYCFQNFSDLRDWLYGHFHEEGEPEEDGLGWISVDVAMPHEDALYLVYSPSADPGNPFIGKARFNPKNDLGWDFDIERTWLSASITHWKPVPDPPLHDCADGTRDLSSITT